MSDRHSLAGRVKTSKFKFFDAMENGMGIVDSRAREDEGVVGVEALKGDDQENPL